jgi:hypothetical protein
MARGAAGEIAARVAGLREAGYRGPVDALGFADSGDRAADMTRNYWAAHAARQEEETMPEPTPKTDRTIALTRAAIKAGLIDPRPEANPPEAQFWPLPPGKTGTTPSASALRTPPLTWAPRGVQLRQDDPEAEQ